MHRMLAVPLLAILVACSESGVGPADAHVGVYNMTTVNGAAVPVVVFQDGNDQVEVTGGAITLHSNSTYDDRVDVRITQAGQVSTETETGVGQYEVRGSTITLTSDAGERFTGTLSGPTLTLNLEGFVVVYRRQ